MPAQSCLTLFNPMDCSPPWLLCPRSSPGKNTGVDCHSLLQGIFLTQGLNSHLLHWQVDFLSVGHQGSPVRFLLLLLLSRFSRVQLLETSWTATCQAPLSMEFSSQEYCSGQPFPSPGNLPDPGIELRSPTLQADALSH